MFCFNIFGNISEKAQNSLKQYNDNRIELQKEQEQQKSSEEISKENEANNSTEETILSSLLSTNTSNDTNTEYSQSLLSLLSSMATIIQFCGILVIMMAMSQLVLSLKTEDPDMQAKAVSSIVTGILLISVTFIVKALGLSTGTESDSSTIHVWTEEELKNFQEIINVFCLIGHYILITIAGSKFIQSIYELHWLYRFEDIIPKEQPLFVTDKNFRLLKFYQDNKFEQIKTNAKNSMKTEILDTIIKNTKTISKLETEYINQDFIKFVHQIKKEIKNSTGKDKLKLYATLEYEFTQLTKDEQYVLLHPDFITQKEKQIDDSAGELYETLLATKWL